MKKLLLVIIIYLCTVNLHSQLRSFNEIFPHVNENIRAAAFSETGYVKSSQKAKGFIILGNQQGSRLAPEVVNIVLNRGPLYLVESIIVLPEASGTTLLEVYNALGNVRDLKGRLYNSYTRNQEVPLFEEATRIISERQTTAIPDPPPSSTLPQSATVFLRLKDINFGNTYYRGDMALIQGNNRVVGLRYTLSNFRSMTYLFVPVIREEKFISQLYFEPIREGLLIYSIAGADISDFFASRISVDSAISKRLAVITSWAADGILNR